MDEAQFPEIFNYRYYTAHYPNVGRLQIEDACRHFLTIGKKRGYMGSPMADGPFFIAWLSSMKFKRILEIGPGVNPSLRGENVAYFDVRKGEEFYAYARSKNVVDVQNLPPVDFYSENGSLKVIDRKFDLVFSSHCIEHTYDIVGHVNDVEGILNEGGVYCLIVPDKRYCFDHFRSVSSLGDIIGRACDKNTEYHSLKVFVDSLVRTHNDSARHWNRDNGVAPSPSPEVILQKIDEWKTMKGKNPGPHAWVFTDESFSENFSSLHAAGITKLTPVRVYNTPRNSNGFCVVMKRAVL